MTNASTPEYKESAGACVACGNSPVNHFAEYISNTTSVFFSRRYEAQLGKPRSTHWKNLSAHIITFVMRTISSAAYWLGCLRFSSDPTRARSYRSQVVWEEAARRGIAVEQVMVFGVATDVYRARIAGEWIYFDSIPVPAHLTHDNASWIDDKFSLKRFLRSHGIPVPRSESVVSEAQGISVFNDMKSVVVVKPRVGSRARHTTTNVSSPEEFRSAFRLARKLCRYVSLEEHLAGSVCRGTVIGGILVGFLKSDPARITGDGHSTVEELIAAKNAGKPDRVNDVIITGEHRSFLARQGYALDSLLPANITVALTHRTGRLLGGETHELLESVHPKLRAYLERAAQFLKAPLVGFDLIIPDPEADPDDQQWGIIEANSLPYIDLHYLPLTGKPSNTAAAVWDLWETASAS